MQIQDRAFIVTGGGSGLGGGEATAVAIETA
jgi:NAD(P)-dependent dehydrogenase (short-subunit alcohol dehydrogenase family)